MDFDFLSEYFNHLMLGLDILIKKYVYFHCRSSSVLDFFMRGMLAELQVKKGEMLFGFQPYAMHDGRVFESPDKFLPRRFMGSEGEELIQNVFWSNGRETETPSVHNKQCAGKDLVVTISRAYVAEMFLRYKEFTLDPEGSGNAIQLFFSSLTRA